MRRPRSASSSVRPTTAGLDGQPELLGERLDEAGDGQRGAREHAALDGLGALLHPVEVQRVADGVGELVHALLERGARGGDELRVALDLLERREQPDVADPLARVLRGEPAALGERVHDGVQPAGGGAGEQAARAVGDGDVGEAGDVDVEDGAARRLPGAERADHAERGEVDALEL